MVLGGTVDRDTEAEPTRLSLLSSPACVEPELELRVLTNAAMIIGPSEEAIGGKGRHFELIALLALSGGLSKEDARAAIYGSGSSTENVTNVASQARKMLGTDSDGQLFLPEASSKGVLALSPRVTTDLTRLCDTVSAAATADPAEAIDLYTDGSRPHRGDPGIAHRPLMELVDPLCRHRRESRCPGRLQPRQAHG